MQINVVRQLNAIVDYYTLTRGVGHTQMMMRGVDCTKNPTIIAGTKGDADFIRYTHGGDVMRVLSIGQDLDIGLRGHRSPLAFDNQAIHFLCRASLTLLADLEANLGEARRNYEDQRWKHRNSKRGVEALQKRLANILKVGERKGKQLDELREENRALTKKINALINPDEEMKKLHIDNSDMRKRNARLDKTIDRMKAQYEVMQKNNTSLRSMVRSDDALSERNDELLTRNAELQKENHRMKKRIDNFGVVHPRQVVDKLQAANARMERDLAAQKHTIGSLRRSLHARDGNDQKLIDLTAAYNGLVDQIVESGLDTYFLGSGSQHCYFCDASAAPNEVFSHHLACPMTEPRKEV